MDNEGEACHTEHRMWKVWKAGKKRVCAQTAGYCGEAGAEKPGLNWGVSGDEGKEKNLVAVILLPAFTYM